MGYNIWADYIDYMIMGLTLKVMWAGPKKSLSEPKKIYMG